MSSIKKGLKQLKSIFSPKGASRTSYIVLAGILSIPFTLFIVWITNKILNTYFGTSISQILEPRGAWTLITLIFSSPVALVVWHFRDENTKQQIENQRKDINLKEFQKIAEWISGIHFPEYKEETKISKHTFYDRYNIAIGLQISSVYSILPFYRGDYGDFFIKPSLNLLKSTWQALQFNHLKELNNYKDHDDGIIIADYIKENVNGGLGMALTQVLLADDGKYLLQHPEEFSTMNLSGIDLHLFGLSKNICEKLFCNLANASGIQLQAANLYRTKFINSNLSFANFQYANLTEAHLSHTNLYSTDFHSTIIKNSLFEDANLENSNLKYTNASYSKFNNSNLQNINAQNAIFIHTEFSNSNLLKSNLKNIDLSNSIFKNIDLGHSDLFNANLSEACFEDVDFSYSNLQEADLSKAIFKEVYMSKSNLVNAKGITRSTLESAKEISGLIIDFRHLYDEKIINDLKQKGVIFIKGEKINILTPHQETILSASNSKLGIKHKYEISNFEIDLQKTKEFNPDWTFILNDMSLELQPISV